MPGAQTDSPLPPATFFVLFALASGDKHGYAILKEARELSGNRFRMGPATLYTTVQRLTEYGWISPVPDAKSDDPRRRYYRLTPVGLQALQNELHRMEALVTKSKAMPLRPAESAS
ncbi:MAG TPA: PadR family transcriptional regulator [Bryobacteraceae bacterium]|nr:PadR family transcriptional regulator [Bryobacteraceae bacterium]